MYVFDHVLEPRSTTFMVAEKPNAHRPTESPPRSGASQAHAHPNEASPDAVCAHRLRPLFDIEPPARIQASGGRALGRALGLRIGGGPATLTRNAAVRRRGGWDHAVLWRQGEGRCVLRFDGGQVGTAPGDILLLDLATSFEVECTSFASELLVVPTWVLPMPGMVRTGGLHKADGCVARLARPQLDELARHGEENLKTALDALLALFSTTRAATPDTGSMRVHAAIRAGLGCANLSPADIARACGMSRSALYRMMAHEGGIAQAILDARLASACRHLAGPGRPSVDAAASAAGFASRASFSRAFTSRCGLSPKAFRAALHRGNGFDPRLGRLLAASGRRAA